MKTLIGFIFIAGLLVGCNGETQPQTMYEPVFIEADTVDENVMGSALVGHDDAAFAEDTVVDILFDEFSMSINRLIIYDDNQALEKIQGDTVVLHLEYGERIEGKTISIISDQLLNVMVEQCYETSLAVSAEGPHCDLYDWKHHVSDWKKLKRGQNGSFIGWRYTEEERSLFPDFDQEELLEATEKECEGWGDNVKDNPNATYIAISHYFLRVSGVDKASGEIISKMLIFKAPMGC